MVLHGDDDGARFGKQLARRAAHVTKALHGHFRALDVQARELGSLNAHGEHAAAGGFHAAQRAAQVHGLAGDHAGGGGTGVHGVGVHHPGHDLAVGVHVRRGDVLGGADHHADLAGVATRQAFQLRHGELARVHADTALGAAVGHVDRRVLHRHPGRQGHHFRQRHVLVEAHAALAGAATQVVLHAVALEVGDGAVIELDGHIHDQDALGALECFYPACERAQIGRDAIHLLEVVAPRADVLGIQVGGKRVGSNRSVFAFGHGLCLV
ncbi:hypothetical protein SDC9_98303 [bioreactor metagenome]|uniref:Uncharacterized protein n=1 Tax=bioreactor metagenome TaxID=1076179 RepID=A0A645APL4_9ZZZZ